MGKEYKEWINVIYITDALYCTHETNNIVSQLYPNKILKNHAVFLKKIFRAYLSQIRAKEPTLSVALAHQR